MNRETKQLHFIGQRVKPLFFTVWLLAGSCSFMTTVHAANAREMGLHTSGGETVNVNRLSLETDNQINGNIDADGVGTEVSIGDVNLAYVGANSMEIQTINRIDGNVQVGPGEQFELGTVKLQNLKTNTLKASTNNRLAGQAKINRNSSVSLGSVNVGNHESLDRFSRNRASSAQSATPDNLLIPDSTQGNEVYGQAIEYPDETQKLSELKQDLLYAYMNECTYGPERCEAVKEELNGWELQQSGLKSNLFSDSVDALVFKKNDQVVVAFRGTEFSASFEMVQDNASNINPGLQRNDWKTVKEFAQNIVRNYGLENIIFTGHSKGGGEALWAAQETGAKAVTFNHRPQHNTAYLYDQNQARGYYVKGEILSPIRPWLNGRLTELEGINGFHPFGEHSNQSVINGLQNRIEQKNKGYASYTGNIDTITGGNSW